MRYHRRLAHRRRVWPALRRAAAATALILLALRRAAATAVLLLLVLLPDPAAAQTLTLPANAPDSLVVGTNRIVRPVVRDALGRSTTAVRVQAWSSDTTALRVEYVAGGQRLTAVAPGTVTVAWRWQRTDGTSRTLAHAVRVVAPATTPPPTDPPPPNPPVADGLVSVEVEPAHDTTLAVGDSVLYRVVGATRSVGGVVSPVPPLLLRSYNLRTAVVGDAGVVAVRPSGYVVATADGVAQVDVCAATVCARRVVTVGTAGASLRPTRWAGVEPGTEPCLRPLVAGEYGGTRADTALFIRPLDGLPAWVYCVADSLVVLMEGDLVQEGDTSSASPTLWTYPAGEALPLDWPATGRGDTTVRPVSLTIVGDSVHRDESGPIGTVGLVGGVALLGLLGAAAAGLARGRGGEGDDAV